MTTSRLPEPYSSFSQYNIKVTHPQVGSDMYCCEFVDGLGKVNEEFPKFYSRWPLWAKAHALQYYADELYRIKATYTQVDG